MKLSQELAGQGVRFVRISCNEKTARVEAFVKKHHIEFPVLIDPDISLAQLLGVKYFPTTIIIDSKGIVRFAGGLMPEDDLRTQLAAVLKRDG